MLNTRPTLRVVALTALFALLAVLLPGLSAASAAPGVRRVAAVPALAPGWEPGPATYGIVVTKDVPITMRDGRVLRAAIHAPADPATGKAAPGPFPVILVQTPYGKSFDGQVNDYMVRRGYIFLTVDVAGTGGSEGQSQLFGQVEAEDGAELVDFAAQLPHSTGKVGATGFSYLGIDQVFTASEVGPNSPLKAIFPVFTAADPYRDLFVSGGVVNMESSLGLIAGYFGLRTLTPLGERMSNPFDALRLAFQHGLAGIPFELTTGLNVLLQQGRVYDSEYWQERAPQRVLQKVVDNGVAAYIVGGQYDVFQRGEPLLYSGLQNAWAGRSVTAPMLPDQQVTSDYQLLWGPWDHGNQGEGIDLDRIKLAWFDHYLKGVDTGITDTDKPFEVLEGDSSYRVASYPSEEAQVERLHLAPGKKLTPAAVAGANQSIWFKGLSLACSQAVNQWAAGALRAFVEFCHGQPALQGLLDALQPGDATWDTAPLAQPMRLSGPLSLTLNATSNRPETMFVTEVYDVAPDGTQRLLTGGAQLGSLRAVDPVRSWAAGNDWIMPYHPLTKASAQKVPVGQSTRYDIEIRPSFVTIPAGHRLRLKVKTGDTPHLLPPPMKLLELLGGLYRVQPGSTLNLTVDR
ncbi:CocE/NonD family hydrolase [Nocardioides daejeonensis]|uniref:CocE/NonD family hydrolase n=1 Tax=Nocardioides daejeonensis TaxID=1046556 RepID=UPI000D7483A0|nr:CocE/NonD family hydrolase [Nocardioides daejeonensis]